MTLLKGISSESSIYSSLQHPSLVHFPVVEPSLEQQSLSLLPEQHLPSQASVQLTQTPVTQQQVEAGLQSSPQLSQIQVSQQHELPALTDELE